MNDDTLDDHYNCGYGFCPTNDWGAGNVYAPYAEGDIVEIPPECIAWHDRMPHSNSKKPGLWKQTNLFRVISAFSISEKPEWYFRVAPIINGKTVWDEHSDRLHLIPGLVEYTEGWKVIEAAERRPMHRLVETGRRIM
jgi:hypothetical protein